MCLISNNFGKIANYNIPVYKVVFLNKKDNTAITPVLFYKMNCKVGDFIIPKENKECSYFRGTYVYGSGYVFAYSNKVAAIDVAKICKAGKWSIRDFVPNNYKTVILKCIIPKGTKYARTITCNSTICAKRLQIVEIIE